MTIMGTFVISGVESNSIFGSCFGLFGRTKSLSGCGWAEIEEFRNRIPVVDLRWELSFVSFFVVKAGLNF